MKVFRPRLGNLAPNYIEASRVARPLIAVGLMGAAASFAVSPRDSARGLAAVALIVAVALLPMTAYLRRARLTIGETSVVYRALLGRPVEVPRGAVAHIALRSIAHRSPFGGAARDVPNRKAFFVAPDGLCLLKLEGWFWSSRDFHQMAQLLSVPCDPAWVDAKATALRTEIRGSLHWYEVDPTLAILGAIAVLFALGIGVAYLYTALWA